MYRPRVPRSGFWYRSTSERPLVPAFGTETHPNVPLFRFLAGGPQKGPAERGHVKKCQKSSKSFKIFSTLFDHFSRRAKNIKIGKKVSKIFSTLFNHFRAAPVFRPLWGALIWYRRTSAKNTLQETTLLRTPDFWYRSSSASTKVSHKRVFTLIR